jgi:hypothetical protein
MTWFGRMAGDTGALAFAIIALGFASPARAKSPVEFWHVGDDGLSEHLADTVEAAIKSSPDFELAHGQAGAIKLAIPANVRASAVGVRQRVNFLIEVSIPGRPLAASSGACFDDRLQECANSVLKTLRRAAAAPSKGQAQP